MSRVVIDPFLCCAIASDIALFEGFSYLYGAFTQDQIDARWNYSNISPSVTSIRKKVSIKHIKWYIRNFITIEDDVWNGDFLAGLSTCGKVTWCMSGFPSFFWMSNESLMEVLNECPFSGKLKNHNLKYYWSNVPSLYLKSSEDTVSFMAGVLATGKLVHRSDGIYASYSKKVLPYLERWGIPIEYQSPSKIYNLISPIWPSLFSRHMPKSGEKWNNIKNGGVKSEIYAPILWRMFVSNKIPKLGIPYLRSRQWVYQHLGKMESTEHMWLNMGLSQLDNRIKSIVQFLAKNV